ncbi:putative peptidoglycan-binding domain-containing protein [Thermodesulfobacteriota bacterium]
MGLAYDGNLKEMATTFFRWRYWGSIPGDELPWQDLADELYGTAVNNGANKAVRFLQEALNLLNRNAANRPDIAVDGAFGPVTMHTLYLAVKADRGTRRVLDLLYLLQGEWDLDLAVRHPPRSPLLGALRLTACRRSGAQHD